MGDATARNTQAFPDPTSFANQVLHMTICLWGAIPNPERIRAGLVGILGRDHSPLKFRA